MLGRVDVPPTLVVTFKVQTAGRDDAKQGLQWRERHRSLGGLGQARTLAALQIRLVLGRAAITFDRHTLAQACGVLGQVQDVGVTPFSRHRIALGQGHGSCCAGSGRRKSIANEISAAFFAFGKDRLDATLGQEVFRCFLHPSRIDVVFFHTNSSF